MERNATESLDEGLLESKRLAEKLLSNEQLNELISETEITKKSFEELKKDQEALNIYLNELKKENFKLEATVKAWKTTLTDKLEEFRETDLKLDKIYSEIRSEREDFCSKLDKFNNEYGVLSDWWKKQMDFVTELGNIEENQSQEEKYKQEIKQLEEDIETIKKQIEQLQGEKKIHRIEVIGTGEIDSPPSAKTHDSLEELSHETTDAKKIRITEENDGQINVSQENENDFEKSFYSLVDMEKVRMATRRNNRRKVFLKRIKNLFT